jgi:hypothetical protein
MGRAVILLWVLSVWSCREEERDPEDEEDESVTFPSVTTPWLFTLLSKLAGTDETEGGLVFVFVAWCKSKLSEFESASELFESESESPYAPTKFNKAFDMFTFF